MRTSVGVVAALALSVACGGKSRAPAYDEGDVVSCDEVPLDRLPAATSAFTQMGCNRRVEGHLMQRGHVTVPLSPGSAETLRIAIGRVFSSDPNPRLDPIVYLDGGPGGASLRSADWLHPLIERMSPDRDIIFIDQRGVGQSSPNLQCTETQTDVLEAVEACYDRLSADVDLNKINTKNNAADIDQVRQALGYEQWNLLGISYGTRLGLTVMRDYPEGIRAVLLDSVVPLHRDVLAEIGINGYRSLLLTLDACAADTGCASAYPDPLTQLREIVVELNEEPEMVGGLPLEGDYFLRVVFNLLYSPVTIGMVPLMIDEARDGSFDLFQELEQSTSSGAGLSFGMHLSLHCAEEVPFSSRQVYEAFDESVPEEFRSSLSGLEYLDWCARWPVVAAPATENEPVESDIPSFVVAGEFDPITPPEFAEAAQEYLTNSTYVMIENDSHGASLSACGVEMARGFFDDPTARIDSTCVDFAPDLQWLSLSRSTGRQSVRSDPIFFFTEYPSDEQLARAKEDLERRLEGRARR